MYVQKKNYTVDPTSQSNALILTIYSTSTCEFDSLISHLDEQEIYGELPWSHLRYFSIRTEAGNRRFSCERSYTTMPSLMYTHNSHSVASQSHAYYSAAYSPQCTPIRLQNRLRHDFLILVKLMPAIITPTLESGCQLRRGLAIEEHEVAEQKMLVVYEHIRLHYT